MEQGHGHLDQPGVTWCPGIHSYHSYHSSRVSLDSLRWANCGWPAMHINKVVLNTVCILLETAYAEAYNCLKPRLECQGT